MQLITDGMQFGLSLAPQLDKLKDYLNGQDGTIKIVLLGSFSDGKTSVIAGMLGEVEENMKIDSDESSDELSFYHIKALGKDFEVVDTPGLFGTKEKEVDGEQVRFSEITERYISEAHIVIYVTNPQNTLKDSHRIIIKRVLRDFNKLDSTIFVINKMDQAADMEDEDEYKEVATIKREALITRLRQTIDLSAEEENRLHIACIAANPYGDGLQKWLQTPEEYRTVSHIDQLQQSVDHVVQHSDKKALRENAKTSVMTDIVNGTAQQIISTCHQLEKSFKALTENYSNQSEDLSILKSQLVSAKGAMTERFTQLKNSILTIINNIASLSELAQFIETEIGFGKNEKGEDTVDFHMFDRATNQILSECTEQNNAAIQSSSMKLERTLTEQNDLTQGLVAKGLQGLSKIKVTGSNVLAVRNVVAKGYKFKPWGATKLAGKLTKWAGGAASVLAALYEAWNFYKKYKDGKKLAELKQTLKDFLNECFKDLFSQFNNDEMYFKNFAPSFAKLQEAVAASASTKAAIEEQVANLRGYKTRFEKWYGHDIEDAEFEEIEE